jgi:hypothetical protein
VHATTIAAKVTVTAIATGKCVLRTAVCNATGLDGRAAAIVMSAVRNVASSGRTVMVTIHQPSIEIFEAFDTLLLLQVCKNVPHLVGC